MTQNSILIFSAIAFTVLSLADVIYSYFKKDGHYAMRDSATSLMLLVISVVVKLAVQGLFLASLAWAQSVAILNIEASVLSYIALYIIMDLLQYCRHLLGHKIRFIWAGHAVHHSSKKMNLITGLRIDVFSSLYESIVFLTPLVLMGFSIEMVLIMYSITRIHVFLTHTDRVGKLGWLEYIFVTPSHHRVHHGKNAQYLDKNMGQSLIIWDRLFGTFEEEQEKVEFGVTKDIKSDQVLDTLTFEWRNMIEDASSTKSWSRKLAFWFRSPAAVETMKQETVVKKTALTLEQSKGSI